ncbi:MAG: hypothetical protein ACKVGZ_17485 [Alphaproteobacteria bacterium]
MAPKRNPLKLNPLQLKTLTVFQQLATVPELASTDENTGEVLIRSMPRPHGDHFHCGDAVVERKGLARSMFPGAIALLPAALSYDTGLSDQILHRPDH